MTDYARSTVNSAFAPLTPEQYDWYREHGIDFMRERRRLQALGTGSHSVSTRWLRRALGTKDWDETDRKLMLMSLCGLLAYHPQRYGDKHMATITLQDLDALNEETIKRGEDAIDSTTVKTFLDNFGLSYRKKTDGGFDPTGKDWKNAKRILKIAGGLDEAQRLMRVYFSMPYEHRGDRMSFTGFYLMVPEILTQEATNREYVERRAAGAAAAASRQGMMSDEEFKRQVEEARQRRERIQAAQKKRQERDA